MTTGATETEFQQQTYEFDGDEIERVSLLVIDQGKKLDYSVHQWVALLEVIVREWKEVLGMELVSSRREDA